LGLSVLAGFGCAEATPSDEALESGSGGSGAAAASTPSDDARLEALLPSAAPSSAPAKHFERASSVVLPVPPGPGGHWGAGTTVRLQPEFYRWFTQANTSGEAGDDETYLLVTRMICSKTGCSSPSPARRLPDNENGYHRFVPNETLLQQYIDSAEIPFDSWAVYNVAVAEQDGNAPAIAAWVTAAAASAAGGYFSTMLAEKLAAIAFSASLQGFQFSLTNLYDTISRANHQLIGSFSFAVQNSVEGNQLTWKEHNGTSIVPNGANARVTVAGSGARQTFELRPNITDPYLSYSRWKPTYRTDAWHETFAESPTAKPFVGDFDGNGRDDIAWLDTADGSVRVQLSQFNGSVRRFQDSGRVDQNTPWLRNFCPGTGSVIQVGHFNRDSAHDLACFSRGTTGTVRVALSAIKNWFSDPKVWLTGFAPGAEIPSVGDFNRDGLDDIITFDRSRGDVYVALNAEGWFSVGQNNLWHDTFCFGNEECRVGDFNADGYDDIAAFNHGDNADVWVALNRGASGQGFTGTGWKWHTGFAYGASVARVWRDSTRPRFATPYKHSPIIAFTMSGPAVWAEPGPKERFWGLWNNDSVLHGYFGIGTETVNVGDFDGDGTLDLVTFVGATQGEPNRGRVYVASSYQAPVIIR
jgi:hypothetical protein